MFAGEFHKLIDVLEHTSQDAGPSFIYEPIKVLKCFFAVCDRIVWDSCPLIQLGSQLVLVHGCLHALEEELPDNSRVALSFQPPKREQGGKTFIQPHLIPP